MGVLIKRYSENLQQNGEQPCDSFVSIKLLRNFIEIALWHGCFPVNFLHISRTTFPKNTSGRLSISVETHLLY